MTDDDLDLFSYGERVLVRIVEKEKAPGLIIVPDEKKEFQIGRVVSIGDTLQFDGEAYSAWLKIGDYVYSRRYAGLLIEYDGVEYVSLDHKEILAYSEEMK